METEAKKGVSPAVASGVICFLIGVAVGVGLSMFRDWNWYTPFGPGPAGAAAQAPISASNLKVTAKDVTAEKLGKDFADDAETAKKAYDTKPILITGEVEKIDTDKKEIRLASGASNIAVVLLVKDLVVPDAGKKYQLTRQPGGKLKSFADKTVIIEYERVDLKPMADKTEKEKAEKDKAEKDKAEKDKAEKAEKDKAEKAEKDKAEKDKDK